MKLFSVQRIIMQIKLAKQYIYKPYLWIVIFASVLLLFGKAWRPTGSQDIKQLELREKVLEMFQHAYTSYMKNAYPADELMPIACKGRIRGITPSRGDIDDVLGNFSLTLVDTLDTLAVLGLYDEFEEAVKKVEKDVNFETDVTVSVFETIIRMLGGLLGGHSAALEIKESHGRMAWYNDSLLHMAKELGDRLLPAFNTSSGMPFSRINLFTGAVRKVKDKDTCTACAGTMILEMAALSRFTGEAVYEKSARRAMDYLWSRRQRSSDLMGTVLNVENGEWIRKESGVGAGIDSYYEYLLKAYILLGDETYLQRFNTHYQAIKQYMNQGPLLIDVLMHKPTTSARGFVDALSAFWPGLQVLKGDVKSAIETHELLYQVFVRHTFLPEAFTTSFDIHWGQYPLRPEFAESTYLLYKATGDPYYLEVGKTIVENLESKARVDCGFAGIKDVRTFKHEDRMDSYFLAEMFKYLYLLFTPSDQRLGIDLDNYVLTTEAHVLPLKLSLKTGHTKNTSMEGVISPVNAESNFERSCANSVYVQPGSRKSTEELRRKIKISDRHAHRQEQPVCQPPSSTGKAWTGVRQLKAAEFLPGDQKHAEILKKMGINIVVLQDGKVQLVQQHNAALSTEDANEGSVFMQEMIELSKQSVEVSAKPVFVQFISSPYMGSLALRAGSAQFGLDLEANLAPAGAAVFAQPPHGCSPLTNHDDVIGKVVVVDRGQCMFVQKAKFIEDAGGIAMVVLDNVSDSSYEASAPFAMAGDDKTEVDIPAAFLFHKEATILRNSLAENTDNSRELTLLLTSRLKSLAEIILENNLKSHEDRKLQEQKLAESEGEAASKDLSAEKDQNPNQEDQNNTQEGANMESPDSNSASIETSETNEAHTSTNAQEDSIVRKEEERTKSSEPSDKDEL